MKQRPAYTSTAAHQKLLQLSQQPFSLASEATLSSKRLQNYHFCSKHFDFHYWSQRIDDDVLECLQELAEECQLVDQFKAMKSGEVMNAIAGVESENRQVLHTAYRDIFSDNPWCQQATGLAQAELAKLKEFLTQVDSGAICNQQGESFTTMIHVGIGGSDLGPRSVYEALKCFGLPDRRVVFIANVDPDDAAAMLDQVDLSRSLVNIVSKSGTTLETLTNEILVREKFDQAGLDYRHHFIAVTGEGSPLDNPEKYVRSFYIYDHIGGRYSTTSMVGLVMLGFYLGYNKAVEFLRGAAVVDREAEEQDIRQNQALLLALLGIWNHSYLGMASLAILPYSQALHRFPAHLQQCDMESNGKSLNREGGMVDYQTGPVVWGEPGTNGQHAFYQLLHQGTEIVSSEFIGFREAQRQKDVIVQGTTSQQKLVANMLAQAVALACGQKSANPNRLFQGNRPSSILMGKRLTPEVMGALLALYEAKIVFQGFAWNINSFDQEGVQLGKSLATRLLVEMGPGQDGDETTERRLLKAFAIG
ncbi:MAG: glucose-6-phosphate isomerase [Desulfocapsaceae bacterium]|nr:glucose-6-phosphate isomerase [Desulfocapsaceae bacterium]